MGNSTDKAKGYYFFTGNQMGEFELPPWAWTKYRHKKISSIAKFWYALRFDAVQAEVQALESSRNDSESDSGLCCEACEGKSLGKLRGTGLQ
jgi:hypothetical protein